MPRPKIVNTLQEITQGELLTLQDIEPVGSFDVSQIQRIPDINYELNINETIYLHEKLDYYPATTVTRPLSSASIMYIPIIKNCIVMELVLKWALPRLYATEARSCREYIRTSDSRYFIYSYQSRTMMFATVAALYKQLVEELLPLVIVKDREIIKYHMLSTLFSGYIRSMCSELEEGIHKQITYVNKSYSPSKIDQRMIDKWTELVNLAAALATEANHYMRIHQLDRYNKYLAELKQGIADKRCPIRHPDHKSYPFWLYARPPVWDLKKLLEERQLELNPELAVTNTIFRVNPALLTFSSGLQKARSFVLKADSQYEEQLQLLDRLAGYQPTYIAPQEMKASSIDDSIWLLEKNLIEKHRLINPHEIIELLSLAEEGLKLLSLVTMRYGVSLNSKNDYSYFGLVKTNSGIDKDNYSKILLVYYENIFHEVLMQLSTLVHNSPIIYAEELTQFVTITTTIEGYLQAMPNSSAIEIKTIIQKVQNMRQPTVLLRDKAVTPNSEVRYRSARNTQTL